MNEQEIYLDKIKLGAVIVEKELLLIEQFNRLISDIRTRPEILKIINDYPTYFEVWRSISELYDFLANDYAKKVGAKERNEINKVMDKYKSFKPVSFQELSNSIKTVLKIMSLSKFHDLIRKAEYERGLGKVHNRYKLPQNDE